MVSYRVACTQLVQYTQSWGFWQMLCGSTVIQQIKYHFIHAEPVFTTLYSAFTICWVLLRWLVFWINASENQILHFKHQSHHSKHQFSRKTLTFISLSDYTCFRRGLVHSDAQSGFRGGFDSIFSSWNHEIWQMNTLKLKISLNVDLVWQQKPF